MFEHHHAFSCLWPNKKKELVPYCISDVNLTDSTAIACLSEEMKMTKHARNLQLCALGRNQVWFIDEWLAKESLGANKSCRLTFLLLVWTLIHTADDSLQKPQQFMTFNKINGRCQMSPPTRGNVWYRLWDFYKQKGQRSYLPYLTRQMLIRYCTCTLRKKTNHSLHSHWALSA